MAKNSNAKLANPLSSLATLLVGATQGVLNVDNVPYLSSPAAASEMVELYAQVIARDIPFIDYAIDPTIIRLLNSSHLNNKFVIANLKYAPSNATTPLTSKTIFRGRNYGDIIGPYISQLLYLNFRAGALNSIQKYLVPPTRDEALDQNIRNEWGVSLEETINIQNVNLNLLPPVTPNTYFVPKFIYSGRSLAEAVHNDAIYQFFYQSALLLSSLGAQNNSGWPVSTNQSTFITGNGPASLLCILADATGYALKHAFYWKWQHFRKLRPDAFGLWIHDVKSGLVANENNFDISNIILDNQVLDDNVKINAKWIPNNDSYTLSQTYREGSPMHPAYVSGHAIIAGVCATILKIFFDGEQKWLSLPGIISGSQSGIANSVVQANSDGSELVAYNDNDSIDVTVGGEINKLAFNVAMGRNWAGIHYRSDADQGIQLGEQVAFYYMQDIMSTMVENDANGDAPVISFRKFDGNQTSIRPTLCTQTYQ